MMKEALDKHPLAKKIIDVFDLSLSINEDSSQLKVYSQVFIWEFFVFGLAFIVCCILALAGWLNTQNGLMFVLASAILLPVLFFTSIMKRTYHSVFDLLQGTLFYHKGGIYSSNLDESDMKFKISDISRVGIRKLPRRYGDTFQVFVVTKTISALEITGMGLSFRDAQLCAETIRDFLKIHESIQAEG